MVTVKGMGMQMNEEVIQWLDATMQTIERDVRPDWSVDSAVTFDTDGQPVAIDYCRVSGLKIVDHPGDPEYLIVECRSSELFVQTRVLIALLACTITGLTRQVRESITVDSGQYDLTSNQPDGTIDSQVNQPAIHPDWRAFGQAILAACDICRVSAQSAQIEEVVKRFAHLTLED